MVANPYGSIDKWPDLSGSWQQPSHEAAEADELKDCIALLRPAEVYCFVCERPKNYGPEENRCKCEEQQS